LKLYLRLALLIGALLGLFGQGVAMAMSPNCATAMVMQPAKASAAAGMQMLGVTDCCAGDATGNHDTKPVKDTSTTCPIMAGCLSAMTFGEPAALVARAPIKSNVTHLALVTQLSSRATLPEPPPTLSDAS
jgi:hypothetical protein